MMRKLSPHPTIGVGLLLGLSLFVEPAAAQSAERQRSQVTGNRQAVVRFDAATRQRSGVAPWRGHFFGNQNWNGSTGYGQYSQSYFYGGNSGYGQYSHSYFYGGNSNTGGADLDRDGIPDASDTDIDGDGVPNRRDRYDRDRNRS